MQNLTVKNVVLAFVALNVISVVMTPLMFTNMTAMSTVEDSARSAERKATHDEMVRRLSKDKRQASQFKQPAVVKVLDLPDSETLRFNETTFVDLGWRQTAGQSGEWVGHIGSDAEYLQLSAEQIVGILKEAQLKALPLPPVPRAITPREKPAPAPPATKGIDLLGFIPILLGIFFMMYIRYRITQATLDAAQSATGMIQRALSDLLPSSKATAPAKPIATPAAAVNDYSPAAVGAAVKKSDTKKKGTVVRPATGLIGFLTGAR